MLFEHRTALILLIGGWKQMVSFCGRSLYSLIDTTILGL
jgi:hypothetical protein